MATVKEINHDSSTVLANFYTDTIIDADGRATVTVGSALNGSTNGVNLDYDTAGTSNVILVETFAALTGNDLRLRFRIDWSNVSVIPANERFFIDLEDSVGNDIFRVEIASDGIGGFVEIFAQYWSDSSAGLVSIGANQAISDNSELCIGLRAIKETADTNADGEVELFVSGVSVLSISNADNFNRFGNQVARVLVRWNNASGGVGDIYYDEWILDNDNTADLGCAGLFSGYDLIPGGGQP
ncbi:hypothetical protein LCGC14_2901050 [marine sediment metagenome]|uniref:Uncharacterized protein n=1 Tax=marine sediment metagenome TaxID=412755 RepID=A0A0F9AKJ3_9ZZZZ